MLDTLEKESKDSEESLVMVELYERLSSAILISYISQIGLDPAEPYFQYLPEHVRLDPTDAKFVDAIHTDSRTILLLGNSKHLFTT